MEYHVDGSGWNGVTSAYCVCLNKKRKYLQILYEEKNSIEMEYIALIKALLDAGKDDTIYTDSKNMVNQIKLDTMVPKYEYIKELRDSARALVTAKNIKLIWISRTENLAGHILEARLDKIRRYKRSSTGPKKKETIPTKSAKTDSIKEFSEEELEAKEEGKRKIVRITPHMEIIRHCRKLITDNNYGNRGDFDGDKYQQLFGMIAQTVVCDFLGLDWPKESKGFDGGFDLVWKKIKWDVKCEIRKAQFKIGYVHNLSGNQIDYNVEGYIFVSMNQRKNEYEICGFIFKKKLLEKARYFKEGQTRTRKDSTLMTVRSKRGMYELDQEHLTKFKE